MFVTPKWDIDESAEKLNSEFFVQDHGKRNKKVQERKKKLKAVTDSKECNLSPKEEHNIIENSSHISKKHKSKKKKKKKSNKNVTEETYSSEINQNKERNLFYVTKSNSREEEQGSKFPKSTKVNKLMLKQSNGKQILKHSKEYQQQPDGPVVDLQKDKPRKRKSPVSSQVNSLQPSPKKRKSNQVSVDNDEALLSDTLKNETHCHKNNQERKLSKKEKFKIKMTVFPTKNGKDNEAEEKSQNHKIRIDDSSQQPKAKKIKEIKKQLHQTSLQFPRVSQEIGSKKKGQETLQERMLKKLKSSRFRILNEQLYMSDGKESKKYFMSNPDAFYAYHEGYQQQVQQWPINPLDIIIKSLQKKNSKLVIADFGCGDAQLARSVPNLVHSFDLVAVSKDVTACDMSHTPLSNASVDIAVFCLSLMGKNLKDYFCEANRVLKEGGVMMVADIASRFQDVKTFIESLKKFGFVNIRKDLSHKMFYFMDFKKVSNISKKTRAKLQETTLKPCMYKKR